MHLNSINHNYAKYNAFSQNRIKGERGRMGSNRHDKGITVVDPGLTPVWVEMGRCTGRYEIPTSSL